MLTALRLDGSPQASLRSFARQHQLDEATLARRARHSVPTAALPPASAIALQPSVDDSCDARGWPWSVEQALSVGLPSARPLGYSLR